MQIDRQAGREQRVRTEIGINKRQCERMGNQDREDRILAEHGIDAIGLEPFKIIAALQIGPQDAAVGRRAERATSASHRTFSR